MTHPKRTQEEILQRASVKKELHEALNSEKLFKKQRKVELQKAFDLKFWHMKPEDSVLGGMTVAYSPILRDTLNISTALLHPADQFSRYEGSYYAAKSYAQGHNIQLRKPSCLSVPEFLSLVFGKRT